MVIMEPSLPNLVFQSSHFAADLLSFFVARKPKAQLIAKNPKQKNLCGLCDLCG
jgi:hypothetical protein